MWDSDDEKVTLKHNLRNFTVKTSQTFFNLTPEMVERIKRKEEAGKKFLSMQETDPFAAIRDMNCTREEKDRLMRELDMAIKEFKLELSKNPRKKHKGVQKAILKQPSLKELMDDEEMMVKRGPDPYEMDPIHHIPGSNSPEEISCAISLKVKERDNEPVLESTCLSCDGQGYQTRIMGPNRKHGALVVAQRTVKGELMKPTNPDAFNLDGRMFPPKLYVQGLLWPDAFLSVVHLVHEKSTVWEVKPGERKIVRVPCPSCDRTKMKPMVSEDNAMMDKAWSNDVHKWEESTTWEKDPDYNPRVRFFGDWGAQTRRTCIKILNQAVDTPQPQWKLDLIDEEEQPIMKSGNLPKFEIWTSKPVGGEFIKRNWPGKVFRGYNCMNCKRMQPCTIDDDSSINLLLQPDANRKRLLQHFRGKSMHWRCVRCGDYICNKAIFVRIRMKIYGEWQDIILKVWGDGWLNKFLLGNREYKNLLRLAVKYR